MVQLLERPEVLVEVGELFYTLILCVAHGKFRMYGHTQKV